MVGVPVLELLRQSTNGVAALPPKILTTAVFANYGQIPDLSETDMKSTNPQLKVTIYHVAYKSE